MKLQPISKTQLSAYSTLCVKSHNDLSSTRLGRTSTSSCEICYRPSCVGHCGHIELPFLIPHPVYYNMIPMILTSFCGSCNQVFKVRDHVHTFIDYYHTILSTKFKSEQCVCNCTHPTVNVYKYGWTKISAGGYRLNDDSYEIHILQRGRTVVDSMDLAQVKHRLQSVTSDDMSHMHLGTHWSPGDLIIDYVMVLPSLLRPDTHLSSRHDRVTALYKTILSICEAPRVSSHQLQVFNCYLDVIGRSTVDSVKLLKKFISGKTGLIRGNLLAVRNNRCGRTVITTNSYIYATHVGIPTSFSHSLTVFEYVCEHNIPRLVHLLHSSMIVSFGTFDAPKYIGVADLHDVVNISKNDLTQLLSSACSKVTPSTYVERVLMDDDWVFINRQPTLQHTSILAFKTKLVNTMTMQLNLAVTKPFNADFDGDEMSIYVASDYDSRVECEQLLAVEHNLLTVEDNNLLVHPIQDCISAVYLMTKTHTLCSMLTLLRTVDLCHMDGYSVCKWSTRKFLLRCSRVRGTNDVSSVVLLSMLFPEDMNLHTDYIDISRGVIVTSSAITKSHLVTLIKIIHSKYGSSYTMWFISMIQILVDIWLKEYPLSIGYSDCNIISTDVVHRMTRHYRDNISKITTCEVLKAKYPAMRDKFEMQALSIIRGQIASRIRQEVKDYLLSHYPHNSLTVMIDSGARGDFTSVVNMVVQLGQQEVYGRQLPMYGVDDTEQTDPTNHGYVLTAYNTGLDRKGTYYQAAAGRQGVVNTGSGVSDPGVMYRLLWSFLADVKEDKSRRVVNHMGTVLLHK